MVPISKLLFQFTKRDLKRISSMTDEYICTHFLYDLKRCFDDADSEEKGYLTEDQWFNSSIRQFLQNGKLSNEEYKKYFFRIDANSIGKVTWNDLVIYLMKEITVRDLRINNETMKYIHKQKLQIPPHSNVHREMISHISSCLSTGEYITLSPDSIRFWDPGTLAHRRFINEPGNFSTFCIFNDLKILCVATSKRSLIFYELESLALLPVEISASPTTRQIKAMTTRQAKETLKTLKHVQTPLVNSPQALCCADLLNKNFDYTKIFYVGDDAGILEVFKMTIPMRRHGTDYSIKRIAKTTMHQGGINQISPIEALKCYASCSQDHTVKFWNFIDKSSGKTGGSFTILRTFTESYGPVLGFNFSPTQKVLVTFSVSRDGYVWAISPPRRLFKLGGHYNIIEAITEFVTSSNEKYILTMTNRKEFRLWDSCNFRMIYEWADPELQRPENRYSCAMFDYLRHSLITCSSYPSKWTEDLTNHVEVYEPHTHLYPIVGCFYSTIFDQIVTIDNVSNIKIWNYKTGSLETNHKNSWESSLSTLTFSCIDCSNRRLITSNYNCQTKLLNFNSGTEIPILNLICPSTFINFMKCAMFGTREYYICSSWDKQLMAFSEIEKGDFELVRSYKGHKNDITAITEYSDGFISGDIDGFIFEWTLETNIPKCSYELDTSVECLQVIDHFLFVGDGEGKLHVFSLPKLVLIKTIIPHEITKPHLLLSMNYDPTNHFFYTGDSLGYLKKWKLEFYSLFVIEPVEIGPFNLKRCCLNEIRSILILDNGNMIATCGTDKNVRIWRSDDLGYIGFLSNESQWDLTNPASIKPDPFEIDHNHFQIETDFLRFDSYKQRLMKSRSINRSSQITAFNSSQIANILDDCDMIPQKLDSRNTNGRTSSKSLNRTSAKSVSKVSSKSISLAFEQLQVEENEEQQPEEAFDFTEAGRVIKEFITDEEYKNNRPKISGDVTDLLIPNSSKLFRTELQTTARPADIIAAYKKLTKQPFGTAKLIINGRNRNNDTSNRAVSRSSIRSNPEFTQYSPEYISALTKPVFMTKKSRQSQTAIGNRVPLSIHVI